MRGDPRVGSTPTAGSYFLIVQKTKWEAEQFAESWLSSKDEPKKIILEEYAKDFYIWGMFDWIKRRHSKGFPLGKPFVKIRRAHLINYIFPKFGKLKEFTGHRSEEMTDRYDNPYLIDRLRQFSSSRKLIDKTWEN